MTAFRFDPSSSISRGLNASMDAKDDSSIPLGREIFLWICPLSLEITLSENTLLNYLFGRICADTSRLFDKVSGCLRKKN